jgi:hypothetical protein
MGTMEGALRIREFILALCLATVGTPTSATARTWRVERNGTGDFTTVQPAVDAAASGDTIRIGHGRFTEGHTVTCPGWTTTVRVLVNKPVLTLIGTGLGTSIGQVEDWDLSQGFHMGIVAGDYFGNQELHLRDLVIENAAYGLDAEGITLDVENCKFSGHWNSAGVWHGPSAAFRNCSFQDGRRDAEHLIVEFADVLNLQNYDFSLSDHPEWPQRHFDAEYGTDVVIEDCRFTGGSGGAQSCNGANVQIRRCTFSSQDNYAISVCLGGNMVLEDCAFDDQNTPLLVGDDNANLFARRCQFSDVGGRMLAFGYAGTISIQDCDLARGAQGVVWVYDRDLSYPPIRTIDLTNNYWGTTEADSIRAWIRDANDSNLARFVVDYQPYESESTPTERTTWGAVKSLFR